MGIFTFVRGVMRNGQDEEVVVWAWICCELGSAIDGDWLGFTE